MNTKRRESGEQKAERTVKEESKRLGWIEADLQDRRKGDPGRLTSIWDF